jgi:ATP-binding cassette subfamily F protein uup
VNGSGKSSLLNVLADRANGLKRAGEVITGKTVRLGYLTQEPPPVDPDLRVIEAAGLVRGSVRVGKREVTASQLLDRLGLRGERQSVRVADLSGGERRRLQLQMLLMDEPNVLLLDEPTNDLDIDTLTELEDLLDGFGGSVVVVSHDQYFLERATDHVLALAGGKLGFLPGGVDEYLAMRAVIASGAGRSGPAAGRGGAAARPNGPSAAGPSAGPTAGPPGVPTAARLRDAKKELARLDRQLARLADREAVLHEALAAAAADYARLIELGDDLRELQAEKAALEDRWLELAEETSS